MIDDADQRRLFERERDQLAVLVRRERLEREALAAIPSPASKPNGVSFPAPAASLAPSRPVEPWFDPGQMPTSHDLQRIAEYAGVIFIVLRDLPVGGVTGGLAHRGRLLAEMVCPRTADVVSEGLHRLAREISPTARFSAVPEVVAPDALGGTFDCSVLGVRALAEREGRVVRITLSYDKDEAE